MVKKTTLVIVLFLLTTFAGDYKNAFDLSVGLSKSNVSYFPIPAFAYNRINDRHYHEISVELFRFITDSKGIDEHDTAKAFGISYSYMFQLFRIPVYIGPVGGIIYYECHRIVPLIESVPPHLVGIVEPSVRPTYGTNEHGLYLGGLKAAVILGKKRLRLKIQERLLYGMRFSAQENVGALLNTLSLHFQCAF